MKRLQTLDNGTIVYEMSLSTWAIPIIFSMAIHAVRSHGREWWEEPHQYKHWQEIQGNARKTNTKFHDEKYKLAYWMLAQVGMALRGQPTTLVGTCTIFY